MSKKKKKKVKKEDSFSSELEAFGCSVLAETDNEEVLAPYIIPLRHKALNKITGGIVGGKFCEISADSQAGKSFLLYEIEAEAINMGGYALHFDGEKALEASYAKMVGLNMRGGKFILGEKQSAAQKKIGARGEAIIDMDEVFKLMIKFITTVRGKVRNKSYSNCCRD